MVWMGLIYGAVIFYDNRCSRSEAVLLGSNTVSQYIAVELR